MYTGDMKPRLIIEQKITAFVNKYKVLDVNGAGEAGALKALAQQKRLAFKEKVTFYTDEQKSTESFTFRAEKVMDVHGRYFIEDTNGQVLGMFRKEFKKSLLVSSWVLMDSDGNEHFRVKESNEAIAILRRFIGFVPLIGDLLDIVMNFFKYHFSFIDIQTSQEIGQYKKTTLFRDHYQLAMTDEAWNKLDSRVYAAMGVALDALQSR
jgi:hypothetical protein